MASCREKINGAPLVPRLQTCRRLSEACQIRSSRRTQLASSKQRKPQNDRVATRAPASRASSWQFDPPRSWVVVGKREIEKKHEEEKWYRAHIDSRLCVFSFLPFFPITTSNHVQAQTAFWPVLTLLKTFLGMERACCKSIPSCLLDFFSCYHFFYSLLPWSLPLLHSGSSPYWPWLGFCLAGWDISN